MNPTQVPSTALPEGEAARTTQTSPDAVPAGPTVATRGSRWTARRITSLVIGTVLVLLALPLLGGGGTALWADLTQRDGGYATTDVHEFSTSGSALATVSTDLGSAGVGWLYSPTLLGTVRIRVTPESAGPPLFVGIGPTPDVDRYLTGVNHTVITEFWEEEVETVAGGTPQSAPGTQDFWVASDTGAGDRTLLWEPANGEWTVVVMNVDGRPGLDVGADLGAELPSVLWFGLGVALAGAVLLLGGVLLIVSAIRRRRDGPPAMA